jgi:biopolymer transport protein ExbD
MFSKKLFDDENSVEVSLTPLIDTVFVLLIIFVIMAVGKNDSLVDVYLPRSRAARERKKEKQYFLVALDQYKNIFISEKKKIDIALLPDMISDFCKKFSDNPEAILYADKDLFFGEVVDFIGLLEKKGIKKVHLQVKKIE